MTDENPQMIRTLVKIYKEGEPRRQPLDKLQQSIANAAYAANSIASEGAEGYKPENAPAVAHLILDQLQVAASEAKLPLNGGLNLLTSEIMQADEEFVKLVDTAMRGAE